MKQYRYLIIGGGLTGDATVRGIRELDTEGTIGMITMEADPPYSRPVLSKGMWKGRPIEKVWRNTQKHNIDLFLDTEVVKLDPQKKLVIDKDGTEYSYEKLLLATGGTPVHLPFGGDDIIYFRNLDDYRHLRELSNEKERFLVIGGGFIGSEIAAALTMVGKQVTMIFLEDAIGSHIYPNDLAHFLNDYYQQKGVQIVPGDAVESFEKSEDHFTIRSKNGKVFEVDGVIAGIGVRPNISLAQQAGLEVGNGVVVDGQLRTSVPDVYAAGDIANFYHSALGKHVRVEHEDNALKMGKMAGRNMAGAGETYTHVPMFYSDLFDLGYEAVGELSSKLEMAPVWEEPYRIGLVYYLEGQRVRGVLLWNMWDRVPAARELIAKPGPFQPADLTLTLLEERKAK